MTARRRLVLLAALGGAAVALCWLPFRLAPLLPLALLIALRGVRHARGSKDAVLFGLVYGAMRYLVAAHFLLALTRFSLPLGAAFYVLATTYILPYAVAEAWGALWLERRFGLPRTVGLGLFWTLFEKVRTIGDVSFPADLLAHGFGKTPAWLGWHPWIGPFGLTLLGFTVAAAWDAAIEARRQRRRALTLVGLGLLAWLGPALTDPLVSRRSAETAASTLSVGIVQPAIDVRDKLNRERWPELWRRVEMLSERAAAGADFIVWPETARPGPLLWRDDQPLRDPQVQAIADQLDVPILYGSEIARIENGGGVGMYNGALRVMPRRPERIQWYGKQQLLPFAERIPFAELIGFDPARRKRTPGERSLLTLLGNFLPGPEPTVFEIGDARIGVLICYEGQYPVLGRRYRLAGANTLAVLTNDMWWGRSVFAPWHAQMIASQARSLDLPVIRAANSGLSSSSDRDGRMLAASALGEATSIRVPLTPSPSGPTFYARNGDLVIWGILAFVTLWAVVASVRRRRAA